MRSGYCNTQFGRNPFEATLSQARQQVNTPPVNILDSEDHFVIELLVPGRNKEDFKISIEKDKLVISSATEFKPEGKTYTRNEFRLQPFKRLFSLPEVADTENISAQYTNGILVVTIQKRRPEAKPASRTVTVS